MGMCACACMISYGYVLTDIAVKIYYFLCLICKPLYKMQYDADCSTSDKIITHWFVRFVVEYANELFVYHIIKKRALLCILLQSSFAVETSLCFLRFSCVFTHTDTHWQIRPDNNGISHPNPNNHILITYTGQPYSLNKERSWIASFFFIKCYLQIFR